MGMGKWDSHGNGNELTVGMRLRREWIEWVWESMKNNGKIFPYSHNFLRVARWLLFSIRLMLSKYIALG